jgi:hypothetical protein
VPDDAHNEQDAGAASSNRSLREYLAARLTDTASLPEAAEVIAAARARIAATGRRLDAKTILAARDAGRN